MPTEHERLKRIATAHGESVSDFLRRLALGNREMLDKNGTPPVTVKRGSGK